MNGGVYLFSVRDFVYFYWPFSLTPPFPSMKVSPVHNYCFKLQFSLLGARICIGEVSKGAVCIGEVSKGAVCIGEVSKGSV